VTTAARIALGLALGALLASLPFLHYRAAGGHDHEPGGDHAHHTH
jgi:hypothetical protein